MNSGDLVHGKVTIVNSAVLYISKSLREQVVTFFSYHKKRNDNYVMGQRKVLAML